MERQPTDQRLRRASQQHERGATGCVGLSCLPHCKRSQCMHAGFDAGVVATAIVCRGTAALSAVSVPVTSFKSTAWACVPCADNGGKRRKSMAGASSCLSRWCSHALFNGLVYHQVYGMPATRKRLKRFKGILRIWFGDWSAVYQLPRSPIDWTRCTTNCQRSE